MTSSILDQSALTLRLHFRNRFIDKWLAQKQKINTFIKSHMEVGREEALVWNPEWIKNGEKKHYIAMHGPEDNSSLKRVYRGMQITLPMVEKGLIKRTNVPMRSFVAHYYEGLGISEGSAGVTATDTGGTSRSCTSSGTAALAGNLANEGSGLNAFGIVVGSSNTAVARGDNKLTTQITHGTSASTLQHGANSINAASNPSGTITRVRSQRSFTGNPSSTANVQETGIYYNQWMGSSSAQIFCIEHNLNNVGTISNGTVLTVTKDKEITT